MKRVFDILVASAFLIIAAPVLAIIAILVKFDLGSPVLFSQIRPGLNGQPFRLWKFRTMRDAVDEKGVPLPDEVRVTRFGRFLRRSSLDELPEMWNVLVGEMSLVGPRPLLMEYLPLYSKRQARRHEVLPGLTGWAQINGRNALTWEEKFELDVWYVDNRSFTMDLVILLKTVAIVLGRRGISAEGYETMPDFYGSPPEKKSE